MMVPTVRFLVTECPVWPTFALELRCTEQNRNGTNVKKIFLRIALVLVVLLAIALVAVTLSIDTIVKNGIERAGPVVTKVSFKLDGASLSAMSGSGGLKGLIIGNPEGYKTPSAISVADVSVSVKIGSVFSDKVVVRSVNVKSPEITLEGSLGGNNLSKLLANINEYSAGGKKAAPTDSKESKAASRKMQVDEVVITGGKINLAISELGNKSATVPLPEIRLSNLGQGPDGITADELASRVISAMLESSTKAVSGQLGQLTKAVAGQAMNAGKGALNGATDALKGVGGLFKK
jgi:hypothetical protein